ncbi:hypothetical protein L195_g060950, partial [Trifolium pratense]
MYKPPLRCGSLLNGPASTSLIIRLDQFRCGSLLNGPASTSLIIRLDQWRRQWESEFFPIFTLSQRNK